MQAELPTQPNHVPGIASTPRLADVEIVRAEVVPLRPLLVDRRTMAGLMSISERTLQSLTQAGEIPVTRIGTRCLYSPAAVQRWIERSQSGRVAG